MPVYILLSSQVILRDGRDWFYYFFVKEISVRLSPGKITRYTMQETGIWIFVIQSLNFFLIAFKLPAFIVYHLTNLMEGLRSPSKENFIKIVGVYDSNSNSNFFLYEEELDTGKIA